jgi:hypothetical protein
VRLLAVTNGIKERIAIDEFLVVQPIGAEVTLSGLEIEPEQPLATDTVKVRANVADLFLNPVNLELTTWYRVNSNGNFTSLAMQNIGGAEYETTGSIPAQGVDDYVEFYVAATFDGEFSNFTSPVLITNRPSPSWYAPVDLSDEPYPAYYVYSVPIGAVWINEFSYGIGNFGSEETSEYVEIVGPSGANIANWRLEVVKNTGAPTFDIATSDTVTNGTPLPYEHNGFGFWTVGDSGVAGIDQAFSDAPQTGNSHMPNDGGIRLVRSMGADEYKLSYGT